MDINTLKEAVAKNTVPFPTEPTVMTIQAFFICPDEYRAYMPIMWGTRLEGYTPLEIDAVRLAVVLPDEYPVLVGHSRKFGRTLHASHAVLVWKACENENA